MLVDGFERDPEFTANALLDLLDAHGIDIFIPGWLPDRERMNRLDGDIAALIDLSPTGRTGNLWALRAFVARVDGDERALTITRDGDEDLWHVATASPPAPSRCALTPMGLRATASALSRRSTPRRR